ncbi:MAG TPA: SCO family protein [Ideonella sp.]|uniref:SCO family protein n=1 Tax=Ideonella sp. TaxID=1929293 RepID=UPI002BC185B7|nr:SCO family protein [Ideonella sp.]HSI48380.1 SCO family protein [Ideonella sp.]
MNPQATAWSRRRWLAAATALALAACDRPGATAGFKGVDITGAEYASGLSLQDVDGQPRTLAQYKGKVLVVFFGYTQCPDVCPTTMGELAAVKQQLGEQGKDVLPIFVTLDPERDTGPVLKAYMANFGPDFIALRGTPEQTLAAAKSFKVFFAKVPGKTESSYTLDHTAGSYLFDRQGRVRVFTRYGGGPDVLAQDLKHLLAEG